MAEKNYWIILGIAIAVWYLSTQAGRLDRLHHRIEVSNAALDGHLTKRAGLAAELVTLNFLDPASEAYLVQSAHDVIAGNDLPDSQRLLDESELTEAICDAFDDPEDVTQFCADEAIAQLIAELKTVSARVQLAKKFHAEAVADALAIRNQFVVKIFRLAGHAKLPKALEFDDRLPNGFI